MNPDEFLGNNSLSADNFVEEGGFTIEELPQKKSFYGFLGNIPRSAYDVTRGISQAAIHPFETTRGLVDIASGGLAKGIAAGISGVTRKKYKLQPEATRSFEQTLEFLKQRYGGLEQIKQTAYQDPVGFALDVSSALSGTGMIARGVGLTRIGQMLGRAGEITEPLRPLIKGVAKTGGLTTKPIKAVLKQTIGVTTGAGAKSLEQAYRAGKISSEDFVKSMRGYTQGEDIVKFAQEALDDLYEERKASYKTNLQSIEKNQMTTKAGQLYIKKIVTLDDIKRGWAAKSGLGKEGWVPTELSLSGLKNTATQTLKDFNIKARGSPATWPDDVFIKTALPKSYQNNLREVVGRVYEWPDVSPQSIDDLREVIDSYYIKTLSPSSADKKFNMIISSMRNNIGSYLKERVPGYETLNKTFSQQTKAINELREGLGLKETIKVETQINKLKNAMKDNYDFRLSLIKKLEEATGYNLEDMIAGYALSVGVPRGVVSKLPGIALATIGVGATTSAFALLGLPIASPRLMGEFIYYLGRGSAEIENLARAIEKYGIRNLEKTAFQVGRLEEETKKEEEFNLENFEIEQ